MKKLLLPMLAFGAFALHATDGVLQATSAEAVFSYNSVEESPFGLAAADSFAPVTWQTLETVTVTAPDGTVKTEVSNADSRGAFAFTPTSGGVWTLSNSMSGTVKVCVPWSIYGDSENITSETVGFKTDTVESGPNRKTKKRYVLPFAYSGDDWIGDMAKASSLTFTPPSGSGLEEWTLDMVAGAGAKSVALDAYGDWTVTLTFADGTTRTAIISVQTTGFIISFS